MKNNIYTIIGTETYLGAHMMKLLTDKKQNVIGFAQNEQFSLDSKEISISDLDKYKDIPSVDGIWIIICMDPNIGPQKYISKMSAICDTLRQKEFIGDICFFSSSANCTPDYEQLITEETSLTCRNDFDFALIGGENLMSILAYSDKGYAVPHIMRIGVPYGNEVTVENTDDFVSKIVSRVKNKSLTLPLACDAKRSFSHISDICEAAFELMQIEDSPMRINIPGEVKSINEVAKAVAKKHNVTFTACGLCQADDKDFYCGDQILSDELFKKTIQYSPTYRFDSWLNDSHAV